MHMLFVSTAGNACRVEVDAGRVEMLVMTFWDSEPTDDDLREVGRAVEGVLTAVMGCECVVMGEAERASSVLEVQSKRAKHMMMESVN